MPEALELVGPGLRAQLILPREFSSFDEVRGLEPFQKPHPTIWYGVHAPDSRRGRRVKGLQASASRPPGDSVA